MSTLYRLLVSLQR